MLSILATNSIFERTAAKAAIGKLTTRLRWSTLDCRIWTNVRLDILIICNNYWSQRCCNIFDASSLLHITFQASRTTVLAYLRKVRFGYENGQYSYHHCSKKHFQKGNIHTDHRKACSMSSYLHKLICPGKLF